MSKGHIEVNGEEVGQTARVEFWYPDMDDVPEIQVGLVHVRAADDIRISYDFRRDGWVIRQSDHTFNPSAVTREAFAEADEASWHEVAFVEAWGLEDDS